MRAAHERAATLAAARSAASFWLTRAPPAAAQVLTQAISAPPRPAGKDAGNDGIQDLNTGAGGGGFTNLSSEVRRIVPDAKGRPLVRDTRRPRKAERPVVLPELALAADTSRRVHASTRRASLATRSAHATHTSAPQLRRRGLTSRRPASLRSFAARGATAGQGCLRRP
jgi:hypothetical protein